MNIWWWKVKLFILLIQYGKTYTQHKHKKTFHTGIDFSHKWHHFWVALTATFVNGGLWKSSLGLHSIFVLMFGLHTLKLPLWGCSAQLVYSVPIKHQTWYTALKWNLPPFLLMTVMLATQNLKPYHCLLLVIFADIYWAEINMMPCSIYSYWSYVAWNSWVWQLHWHFSKHWCVCVCVCVCVYYWYIEMCNIH